MKYLLTIEDSFSIIGRGVIVLPDIPLDVFEGKLLPTSVILKYENGSEETIGASFHIPRISPFDPSKLPFYQCLIQSKQKEDIPIGTELWLEY